VAPLANDDADVTLPPAVDEGPDDHPKADDAAEECETAAVPVVPEVARGLTGDTGRCCTCGGDGASSKLASSSMPVVLAGLLVAFGLSSCSS
jgi:hypothetical protein